MPTPALIHWLVNHGASDVCCAPVHPVLLPTGPQPGISSDSRPQPQEQAAHQLQEQRPSYTPATELPSFVDPLPPAAAAPCPLPATIHKPTVHTTHSIRSSCVRATTQSQTPYTLNHTGVSGGHHGGILRHQVRQWRFAREDLT